MSKQDKLDSYNPSGVGLDNGHIFGLPFEVEDADIVILPVPWELTTSFGGGTSHGPQAILNASPQLDLYHLDTQMLGSKGFICSIFPRKFFN